MGIPLTARAPVPFTPPTLRSDFEARNAQRAKDGLEPLEIPVIMIRVPTPYERDNFAAALVRAGVVHYSQDQVRDLMRAGVQYLHPADKFDEKCSELEQLWQAADAMRECQRRRQDRAAELIERAGDGKIDQKEIENELLKITPDVVIDEPTRVRITAMQQDIVSRYAPLQKAFADLAEQEQKRAWMCIETYVATWKGLEHTPDGNGFGGITRAEAEWLRNELRSDAFEELGNFIFALHSIDGDEEKNLASLIASFSDPTGSLQATSKESAVSESGTSTDGNITPIPDTASRTTPARSSGSTKPAAKKTARSRSTRTAAR